MHHVNFWVSVLMFMLGLLFAPLLLQLQWARWNTVALLHCTHWTVYYTAVDCTAVDLSSTTLSCAAPRRSAVVALFCVLHNCRAPSVVQTHHAHPLPHPHIPGALAPCPLLSRPAPPHASWWQVFSPEVVRGAAGNSTTLWHNIADGTSCLLVLSDHDRFIADGLHHAPSASDYNCQWGTVALFGFVAVTTILNHALPAAVQYSGKGFRWGTLLPLLLLRWCSQCTPSWHV